MNILYVLNSGKMGGMERHVLELVEGMSKEGEKVFVWCSEGEMPGMYSTAGAEVKIAPIKRDFDVTYIKSLRDFLKEKKIDVIHAHELKAVFNSLIAGFLAGVKVRISHTHTPISTWKINGVKKFLDVIVYSFLVNNFSSKEIALTAFVAKTKKNEGIRDKKICVIPNALNEGYLTVTPLERQKYRNEIRDRYLIGRGDIVFGCVGRLTQEKGLEVLIRAFKLFIELEVFHKHNFYLLIAGGGPLEKSLRDLAHRLSVDENVIFTGAFDDKDKVKIYSAIDVFVFPSYTEGFGIVLIEAMYMGLPIIASDLEVLREVGKDTAVYFKAGSDTMLAEKMSHIYKEIMSGEISVTENSLRAAETEYTMSRFIKNYLDLYRSLL